MGKRILCMSAGAVVLPPVRAGVVAGGLTGGGFAATLRPTHGASGHTPQGMVPVLICPFCSENDDKVIDSRSSEAGRVIRRRRQCNRCGKRFTTYERVEETTRLMVIKRDGSRVPFSRDNILRGVSIACGKRPIPEDVKQRLVEQIDDEIHRNYDREVESRSIGELVAERLRGVDEIAYVRFASEYYQFRSVGDIMQQLEELNARVRDVPNQQPLFDDGKAGTP